MKAVLLLIVSALFLIGCATTPAIVEEKPIPSENIVVHTIIQPYGIPGYITIEKGQLGKAWHGKIWWTEKEYKELMGPEKKEEKNL